MDCIDPPLGPGDHSRSVVQHSDSAVGPTSLAQAECPKVAAPPVGAPINGCLPTGLGYPLRHPCDVRPLRPVTAGSARQPAKDGRSEVSVLGFPPPSQGSACVCSDRQHHRNLLYQQEGGSSLSISVTSSGESPAFVLARVDNSFDLICPGLPDHPSG